MSACESDDRHTGVRQAKYAAVLPMLLDAGLVELVERVCGFLVQVFGGCRMSALNRAKRSRCCRGKDGGKHESFEVLHRCSLASWKIGSCDRERHRADWRCPAGDAAEDRTFEEAYDDLVERL